MKKRLVFVLGIVFVLLFCSCAKQPGDPKDSSPVAENFVLPTAGTAGGYQISTDAIQITVYANGDCKFVELCSEDGAVLQCYFSAAETVLVNQTNGETTYYNETAEGASNYENPLVRIFAGLEDYQFERSADGLYHATNITEREVSIPVNYTAYFLTMTWIDGRLYEFWYVVYENGETFLFYDAPDEMNPTITADTPWVIDMEKHIICNTESGETVAFEIADTYQGKEAPPSGGETETVTEQTDVELVLGEDGQATSVRYIANDYDLFVSILNDFDMKKPIIPENAREMTAEEIQDAMLRASAVDYLL